MLKFDIKCFIKNDIRMVIITYICNVLSSSFIIKYTNFSRIRWGKLNNDEIKRKLIECDKCFYIIYYSHKTKFSDYKNWYN